MKYYYMKSTEKRDEDTFPLSVSDLGSAFNVLITGSLLSIFVFIFELIRTKMKGFKIKCYFVR